MTQPKKNLSNISFNEDFLMLTRSIYSKIQENRRHLDDSQNRLAAMVKLTEEVGELANEVLGDMNLQRKEKQFSDENLGNEMADVIMSLIMLAHSYDLDINELLSKKISTIKNRFGL